MEQKFKQDTGTAGLTILLSIIVMLFIIGLIVMIFTLMSAGLQESSYTSTAVSVSNETGAWLNGTTYTVDNSGARNFATLVITSAINTTSNTSIGVGNFSVSGTGYTNATSTILATPTVWVSYTYTWDADNSATDVMNATSTGIAGVTDWFDIFIVISAMVVLILLTVLIISAIRGSGLIAMGGGQGANQVGTA